MAARKPKAQVQKAYIKALEDSLKQERLAIAAITKVMLLEVPDPARVLARLDAMVRAAEANPRTAALVRRQLLDATRFVRTAIQRELGKPQELFDPDVGHVKPKAVDALVEPTNGPQQLGLVTNIGVEDAEAAHEDRVRTIGAVHEAIVHLLRDGPLTDRELHAGYWRAQLQGNLPQQSAGVFKERRKELAAAGRIGRKGEKDGEPTWGLVEHAAA